jgi:hypothetical protein
MIKIFSWNLEFKVKDCIKDLVIQVDPRHIPYSLFVLFNKLSVEFKCFLKILSHCTAAADVEKNPHCQQLQSICNALKLDRQAGKEYDFGFTIIWKKCKILFSNIIM